LTLTLSRGLLRFKAAIAHWGAKEYLLLASFWLFTAIPLYLNGWGLGSLLGFPLMLVLISSSAWVASIWFKPKPHMPVKPRPGFPAELVHDTLGTFALSEFSDDEYTRTIAWCNKDVRLSIVVDSLDDIKKVLEAASEFVIAGPRIEAQVLAFIVDELLASTNRELKAEGRPALDAAGLLSHATLESLYVRADGSYTVIYMAGPVLGDHWIEVDGTLTQGPTLLNTPG
jgi:hypothetical protein